MKLCGWIQEQNELDEMPTVEWEQLDDQLQAIRDLGLSERAERLLIKLYKGMDANEPGKDIAFNTWPFRYTIFRNTTQQVQFCISHLLDQGFVVPVRGVSTSVVLTAKGCIEAERLLHKQTGLPQGFIAMWFDAAMDDAWKHGLASGIRKAGYDAIRIADREFSGMIDDAIIAEIRRSRFVVADFTGNRASVYYEAGFARGVGLEVISTCRADNLQDVAFDQAHYNCIVWDDVEVLATKLEHRIGAIFGYGPRRTA